MAKDSSIYSFIFIFPFPVVTSTYNAAATALTSTSNATNIAAIAVTAGRAAAVILATEYEPSRPATVSNSAHVSTSWTNQGGYASDYERANDDTAYDVAIRCRYLEYPIRSPKPVECD